MSDRIDDSGIIHRERETTNETHQEDYYRPPRVVVPQTAPPKSIHPFWFFVAGAVFVLIVMSVINFGSSKPSPPHPSPRTLTDNVPPAASPKIEPADNVPPAASPKIEPADNVPPAASPKIEPIHSPALSVGDEFVIEHKNVTFPNLSYAAERKVVSLDGNRMQVTARNINSKYVKRLEYDRQWNLIAERTDGGGGFDYDPPIKYYDFPLYPGKCWSGSSTERNVKTGQIREHSIVAEVGGWETITVPAGTFRTIKVMIRNQVKDLGTGEVTSGTDTSWYAPAAKRSVRCELIGLKVRDGLDDVQIVQLIRYSVK